MDLRYQSGFGNEYATEAIAGALPQGRNSPQRVSHGLYAELLSGAGLDMDKVMAAISTSSGASFVTRATA